MSNLFPIAADSLGNNESGAIFSDCRKYRYALWRIWDESKPLVSFIGLNPSTANEIKDDPTIRRVKQIANNLGYGGVFMLNLFGIISSNPKVLQSGGLDVVGDNDRWLKEFGTGDIIFAWGNFKEAVERSKEVSAMFPGAKALHINKNGSPKHPLYVKSNTIPVLFSSEQNPEECDATEAKSRY